MRVHFVRHGQTAWNAERRYQGHTDIPLDTKGAEQARLLSIAFDGEPYSRVLTSDLMRARMTADALASRHNVPVVVMPELRERSIGDWEGLPMEKVAEHFIEQELLTGRHREEIRPPNGESMQDAFDRLRPVAREIEVFPDPQVVVVHGGSGGMLLARLMRGTIYTARSFRFENTAVTTVSRRSDGGFNLVRYNDSSHLPRGAT